MNRLLIEQPYVMQLSMNVQRFIWIPTQRVARFRCPICGDSQKNNSKTRGYVYISPKTRTHFNYKCHNCGYNNSFLFFLKEYFPNIHSQLQLELMREHLAHKKNMDEIEQPIVLPDVDVNDNGTWITVDKLPIKHEAKQYCLGRQIPTNKFSRIIYVDNFKQYIEEVCPNKYNRMPADNRIVFELRDEDKILVGIQARIIDVTSKKNRFLTLKFDDSATKIYGLDSVNKNLPIIVTEGIIDSLFFDNGIALTGGDVVANLEEIIGTKKSNIYIALDNEPRSKDTVHRMDLAIRYGYKVYFWEMDTLYKDVNDMVKNGNVSISYIQTEIINKSLSGFKARVRFNTWKKI